ncbi:uncharacterized protein HGUI_02982 [Hanseniaspora guilliermondii]|uniref:PIPK domain-containing protein n=1 Tax=Hanseniaspora guilliermondii TaxID=56406 RepID=A0A1L0FMJ4_9ASCO|nr:uncharacterized protein HGUI_02982 [Hanseniaspora guilliermondii]
MNSMVAEIKDASDITNQLNDDTNHEVKELQPSFFVNGNSFDINSKLYNSNGSSPLSSKFPNADERSNSTENKDFKSSDDHEVKRPFNRRKSTRCSSDFRKKSSEKFLQLHKESLSGGHDDMINKKMAYSGLSSAPSTPTTPVVSVATNNQSPVHSRHQRPPFLASKHSQIIPVVSVKDLAAGGNNHTISNINMGLNSSATASPMQDHKSKFRDSITSLNDGTASKIHMPIIDTNAIKEYNLATKSDVVDVVDYKNNERETIVDTHKRDDELVRQLTNIAKQNDSNTNLSQRQKSNDRTNSRFYDSQEQLAIDNFNDNDNDSSETIIDGHSNFTIAYNMLTGINVSVTKHHERMKKKLRKMNFKKKKTEKQALSTIPEEQDFLATEKLKFIHKDHFFYSFKFKDYSPEIFYRIRKIFNIDDEEYLSSLTSKHVLSELNSPGKSGSFFYYSPDNKYIIKTIRRSEHKHLRNHIKEYYEHCKGNPDTLVSQFYGLYRMKLPITLKFTNPPKSRRIYFIVMNNVFPMHIDQSFDLKGSLLGRITNIPESSIPLRQRSFSKVEHQYENSIDDTMNQTNESTDTVAPLTLKDLNWLDNSMRLELSLDIADDLKAQLNRDVALLKRLNAMDYSLLIGIHFVNNDDSYTEDLLSRSISSNDGKKLYFLGIIDCLTGYSFLKKVETIFKSFVHSKNDISAVPPEMYGMRFVNFMEMNVLPMHENKAVYKS